jgi:DNA polymerase-3 subunit delta
MTPFMRQITSGLYASFRLAVNKSRRIHENNSMLAIDYLEKPAGNKTGPVVVVFGKERFLKLESIKGVAKAILGPESDNLGLTRLPGSEVDLKTVVDSLLTISMWHPRQIVLVEDADDFVSSFREPLEAYLDRPAKKAVLILDVKSWPSNTRLAKKVAAIGLPLDCGELKGPALLGWICRACLSRHGKKIDRAAAGLLIELAGTELGLIDQELAKLAAFVGDGQVIDTTAVERLVGGWKTETTWKMLDAVRDGQIATALELLDKLLTAGEHSLKILGGVNYVFRPVAKATELSRQGKALPEALTLSGVKPFNVQPTSAYLKRIGRPRAKCILARLLSADLDLKGASALPDRIIVERLLAQLAGKAT